MNNAVHAKTLENLINKILMLDLHATKKTIQNGHQKQAICQKIYLTICCLQFQALIKATFKSRETSRIHECDEIARRESLFTTIEGMVCYLYEMLDEE